MDKKGTARMATALAIGTAISRDNGILKRVRGTPLPPWIYIAGRVASFNLQIAIREYSRINRPDPWNLAELNQPERELTGTSKTKT